MPKVTETSQKTNRNQTVELPDNSHRLTEKLSENKDRLTEKGQKLIEKLIEKATSNHDKLTENRISILRYIVDAPYISKSDLSKYVGYTGAYEQAKANNIYDLAGNNWEWTQERCGSNYVMRSGGYNLMGGACPGSRYPAAIRDPLPGNNHHPNVCFRVALFLVVEDTSTGINPVTM